MDYLGGGKDARAKLRQVQKLGESMGKVAGRRQGKNPAQSWVAWI